MNDSLTQMGTEGGRRRTFQRQGMAPGKVASGMGGGTEREGTSDDFHILKSPLAGAGVRM